MSISKKRLKDFELQRKTLVDIIEKNKELDEELIEKLKETDFTLLEEHIELIKVIISANKELTQLYKDAPKEEKEEKDSDINIKELLNEMKD